MAEILYADDERTVPVVDPNLTILETSIAHKVPHARECGGNARCTTRRVRILDGVQHVLPRTHLEALVAQARGWDSSARLACQTRVAGDVTVRRLIRTGADIASLQQGLVDSSPLNDRSRADRDHR
jgi:adenylate cyclase